MKVIYYSPIDFHIMVDLQGLEFVDVPLIGSYLPEGVPVCSNIISGESYDKALSKALDDRDLMIRVLGLKSRIPNTNPIKMR
jgi:predicted ATP-grasp superfamily ATP-dependent carboligase